MHEIILAFRPAKKTPFAYVVMKMTRLGEARNPVLRLKLFPENVNPGDASQVTIEGTMARAALLFGLGLRIISRDEDGRSATMEIKPGRLGWGDLLKRLAPADPQDRAVVERHFYLQ